jgi:hypothetical protein
LVEVLDINTEGLEFLIVAIGGEYNFKYEINLNGMRQYGCIPYNLWLMFGTKWFEKCSIEKKYSDICKNCWKLKFQLVKNYLLA